MYLARFRARKHHRLTVTKVVFEFDDVFKDRQEADRLTVTKVVFEYAIISYVIYFLRD